MVGYREQRDAGQLVVLRPVPEAGLPQALHRWLGARLAAHASTAHVQNGVFRRDQTCLLVAVNAGNDEWEVGVWLDAERLGVGPFAVRDFASGAEGQASQGPATT